MAWPMCLWLLQRLDLNLDLSPPAVSRSAVVGLSFHAAAGAESRAGLAAAARAGSGCAEQPGEVGQKWSIRVTLKWRPQTEKKMAHARVRRAAQQREEKLTHAVRLWLWC